MVGIYVQVMGIYVHVLDVHSEASKRWRIITMKLVGIYLEEVVIYKISSGDLVNVHRELSKWWRFRGGDLLAL